MEPEALYTNYIISIESKRYVLRVVLNTENNKYVHKKKFRGSVRICVFCSETPRKNATYQVSYGIWSKKNCIMYIGYIKVSQLMVFCVRFHWINWVKCVSKYIESVGVRVSVSLQNQVGLYQVSQKFGTFIYIWYFLRATFKFPRRFSGAE